ncbi:hypothetical protein [Jonesia denitrificans]|nr:hypothetical protein [Jonesia denitrificans]
MLRGASHLIGQMPTQLCIRDLTLHNRPSLHVEPELDDVPRVVSI